MTNRDRWITWGLMVLASVVAALGARWGIPIPPPPVIVQPPDGNPPPKPDTPPTEPAPDALAAIVRISSGNVGCSATVVGPRRPDGRYWVLSAAHCVNATGQRWTAKFRDGRSVGLTVVNFDRTADWSWMVTDGSNVVLPHAMLAERSPSPCTPIWHAGFGVDVPGNRENGQIVSGPDTNGQLRMKLSVSSGDSGGGIVVDADGKIVSCVCCTSGKGQLADVWGSAPERFRAGQRDTVDLDEWKPLDIPMRMAPKDGAQ
jgi:hypothetical protein